MLFDNSTQQNSVKVLNISHNNTQRALTSQGAYICCDSYLVLGLTFRKPSHCEEVQVKVKHYEEYRMTIECDKFSSMGCNDEIIRISQNIVMSSIFDLVQFKLY